MCVQHTLLLEVIETSCASAFVSEIKLSIISNIVFVF